MAKNLNKSKAVNIGIRGKNMEKRGSISATDLVFWLSLIVLAAWIVGKAIGLIKSPAWVEMIPYASAVFIAGTVWQKISYAFEDIKGIKEDIKKISDIDKRLYGLEREHIAFTQLKPRHKATI